MTISYITTASELYYFISKMKNLTNKERKWLLNHEMMHLKFKNLKYIDLQKSTGDSNIPVDCMINADLSSITCK